VPGLLFFSCYLQGNTGKAACPEAAIDTAHDGLSKGDDDLAGVYIQHALRVVQQ
jgi:hypothetical protein